MKTILLSLAVFFSVTQVCFGQESWKLKIGAGPSFAGSGDNTGLQFFNELEIPIAKRLTLNPGIQLTHHTGNYSLTGYEYRYITTGATAIATVNYALLNGAQHKITIGAGASVRHQRSSDPTSIGVRGLPSGERILDLEYADPVSTFAPGYIITPQYQYMFSPKLGIGIAVMLQNDTRGDLFFSQGIFAAIRL